MAFPGPVSLQDLITRALQRCDMVNNAGTSQYVTTPELTYLANSAHARLYDLLVTTYEDHYIRTKTFTLVGGQESYDLASDLGLVDAQNRPAFYKVRALYLRSGSGASQSRFMVRKFNPTELSLLNNNVITPLIGGPPLLYWRLNGTQLYLEPVGATTPGYTAELWYIPQVMSLVNPYDTLDYQTVFGWDEYIVNDMAINMKIKEESDVSALMARQADFERKVQAAASNRDVSEAARVTDVDRQYNYPWGQYI